MSLRPGIAFLSDCPALLAMEIIASKWSMVTLFALTDGPLRHGELVELSGGISRKVLTQTLRRLQANGLVERHAYAEAPPRVEYGLTDLGRTLEEPIRMLTAWARENGEAVVTFREAADAARTIGADQATLVKTPPVDAHLNRF
ncbi:MULTISPECIES: helix-turn-helix domain-containing protein [unclassified Streptomyces]|uniref:winged helix-turn-helix transcriptional regulator n=1 Tax=unclassified Streptomyces TaxID=2593676 RepID=UPI002E1009B0|nr:MULTISPECIES: helix-turn-helix domain-containing protein [unclassified Streptomyces]WSR23421.1 helix-turn-helix transcriptional regulator [Streptomyces sp. NBC_01205]